VVGDQVFAGEMSAMRGAYDAVADGHATHIDRFKQCVV